MQMAFSPKKLAGNALWTVMTYGVSVVVRFIVNVILTRLVRPEVMGAMMVINTLKIGTELITDVGIGQNIVTNPNGEKREFRNTAWTLQVVRACLLFIILSMAAYPLAQLYGIAPPELQVSALTFLMGGLASTSLFYLQRRMQVIRSNLFELSMDLIGSVILVVFTFLHPNIWGMIVAVLVSTALRVAATYLLPDARNWFAFHATYARQIFSFGKWIFLSSLLSFLSFNFDKLFLAQALPLAMVGVYSIARGIADLPTIGIARLGHQLVFPLISRHNAQDRSELRAQLAPLRLKLLLLVGLGVALGVSFGDVAIGIVYDDRYSDAGWILSLLMFSVWVAVLCVINDYTLLGLHKPVYSMFGNLLKLVSLVVAMSLAADTYGLPGLLVTIILGEVLRYAPTLVGLRREKLSFLAQDMAVTGAMCVLIGLLLFLRHKWGMGLPFDAIFAVAGQ